MVQTLSQNLVRSGRVVWRDWLGLTVTSETGRGEDQHTPLTSGPGSGPPRARPDPGPELNQETDPESGQRLMEAKRGSRFQRGRVDCLGPWGVRVLDLALPGWTVLGVV